MTANTSDAVGDPQRAVCSSESPRDTPPRDTTMPDGKWAFDASVAGCFDDMLSRSIPQYDVMRAAVLDLGSRFVRFKTHIVDVGCSNGLSLEPFVRRFGVQNQYVGLEISDPMIEAAKQRFGSLAQPSHPINAPIVDIRKCDLRTEYPDVQASLVLSVLTIQFTPLEYRPHIIDRIARSLIPGGALILVEKLIDHCAPIDAAFTDIYYALKREHGYSQEAIDRKRLSLEGVLVRCGWVAVKAG